MIPQIQNTFPSQSQRNLKTIEGQIKKTPIRILIVRYFISKWRKRAHWIQNSFFVSIIEKPKKYKGVDKKPLIDRYFILKWQVEYRTRRRFCIFQHFNTLKLCFKEMFSISSVHVLFCRSSSFLSENKLTRLVKQFGLSLYGGKISPLLNHIF